jgi:hypothetical protein
MLEGPVASSGPVGGDEVIELTISDASLLPKLVSPVTVRRRRGNPLVNFRRRDVRRCTAASG